ncbi:MAG: hypothetical protein LUG50_15110, partial [Planctomycetaceae bacterium]|nr:hypothetical protein [Planctomycetaceae bacterium]
TDSRLPDVSPAPAPSPAVPATPVGSSADETVDVPPPPPSDTRATKGTGITKRGITRDMYRREGTARHTGTYRRGQESTNVAILDTEPSEPASDSNRAGTGPSAAVPYPADPARRIGRRLRPFHLALIGFFLVLIGMVGNVIGEMTIPASFVSSRYPAGTVYDITPERDFLPDAEVETYRHMMKITAYTPSSVEVEYYFEGPDSPVVTGDGEKTSLSFSDLLDRRLRTAHQRERYGTGYFPSLLAPAYTAAALAVDGAVVSFVPDVRATPGVRWLIDNIVLGLAAVLAFAVLLAIPTAFDRASAGRTACGAVTQGIALGCLPLVAAVAFGGESAGAMARHFPAAMSVAPGLAVGAFLALVLLALIWPLTGLVALASHLAGGRAGNALRYVVSIVVALLIVSLAVNSATLTIALAVAVLVVAALTGQEPEAAAAVNQPARPSSDGNRE